MEYLESNDEVIKLKEKIRELERLVSQKEGIGSKMVLEAIWNNSEEGMVLSDHQAKIIDVNPAFCQHSGFEREELSGKDFHFLIQRDYANRLKDFYQKIFNGDEKTHVKAFEFLDIDGRLKKVTVKINFLHIDGEKLMLSLIKDIKEPFADFDYEQQSRWMSELSSSIPGAVFQFVLYPDGRSEIPFISENAYYQYILNRESEITAERVFNAIHPGDLAAIKKSIVDSAEKLQPFTEQLRIRTGFGDYLWFEVRSNPRKRPDGTIVWNGVMLNIEKQIHAQKELKESEANLKAIFNNTLQLFIMVDNNYQILSINKIARQYYRKFLKRDINPGESILDLIYPAHLDSFKENFKRALAGEMIQVEKELPLGNESAYFLFNYNPVLEEGIPTQKVIFSVIDISERKKATLELFEKEQQLKLINDSINEMLFMTDRDLKFNYISASVKNIFGYTSEEFMALNFLSILSEESRQKSIEILAHRKTVTSRKIIDRETKITELNCIKKSGDQITVNFSTTPYYDQENNFSGIIGVARDITEERQKQIALKESEERYRFFTESTSELICHHDPDGSYRYISPSVKKMLGYEIEELIGANPYEYLHPEDISLVRDQSHNPALQGNNINGVEFRMRKKDGSYIWLDTLTDTIQNDKGKVTSLITRSRDITDRKIAEKERNISEEKFRLLFENMNRAFALNKILTDKNGKPIDYVFTEVNSKFEELTGLKREAIIGKRVLDILPKTESYWIEIYGKVAIDGKPIELIDFSVEFNKYYETKAYCPQKGYFAVTFTDITEMVAAQKALKESENKFKLAATSANDIIIEWSFKDDSLKWHGDGSSIFGSFSVPQTVNELIQYIHPNEQIKFKRQIKENIDKKLAWLQQYRLKINGRTVHVSLSGTILYNKKGDAVKLYGAITDISERMKLIQDLKKSKMDLEIRNFISNLFIKHKGDEVYDHVLKGILKELKSQFGYFGYINESGQLVCPSLTREIWGHGMIDEEKKSVVFKPDKWEGLWGESLKQKKSLYKNGQLKVPVGHVELKNVIACPILYRKSLIGQILVGNYQKDYKEKHLLRLEAICNYISPLLYARLQDQRFEQKLILAKENAENNAKLFKTVFDQAEVGIVIINPDSSISRINQKFCDILGFKEAELQKKSFFAITHPDDQAQDHEIVDKIKNNQLDFFYIKKRYIHKSGKTVFVNGYATLVKDEQNQIKYAVGVINDVTRQKLAEESLIQNEKMLTRQNDKIKTANFKLKERNQKIVDINEKLKKANSELDSFVYRVSHDLRAPITSSLGLAKLTKQSNDLEEVHQYSQLQTDSLVKLDQFIKDILNYSRNSRMEVEPVFIDFTTVVEDILNENRYTIDELNIHVDKLIKNDIAFKTDLLRVKIILQNLISNAIKFQNPYLDQPFLKIEIVADLQQAYIQIKDNGIGIDPVHHEKIYNMFFRANDKRPGSGIGLYIVKDCLFKINGEAELESNIGEGTTFTIRIPNLSK